MTPSRSERFRVTPAEYEAVDLRAYSLLAGVPLHDVWSIELPGGGSGRTILDLRSLMSLENVAATHAALRLLFALRRGLGKLIGWDREPPGSSSESFIHKLSPQDRERSLIAPGTFEGPFRVLFASPREAISEIVNSTVHAFSVFALVEFAAGYRVYWGIYVRPVGRITAWYMRLIDPFRRFIIYPAVLRRIRAAWARDVTGSA
jgi:hypothetical protein